MNQQMHNWQTIYYIALEYIPGRAGPGRAGPTDCIQHTATTTQYFVGIPRQNNFIIAKAIPAFLFTYLLTYLLTYSMVQSPSWEANWFEASQEIPRISRNPRVHYRTHKRPPPVSILGQPNPVHIPTSHLLEIHPNIIHPSTPRSP